MFYNSCLKSFGSHLVYKVLTDFKKTQGAVMTQVGLPFNILTELATVTKPVHTNVIG
jgi:hypothetical protein